MGYPLAGLHEAREATCLLALVLASLAASTFCLALGALAPRSAIGLPLAVLLLLVGLLFGGCLISDAPHWLASMSFFRASYEMLVANEFQGSTFLFDPVGIEKDFDPLPGEEWLRLLHFEIRPVVENAAVLLGW